jgi:hypothetical protein
MMIRGHVENGVVVLDEPADLPEGANVEVSLGSDQPPTLWEMLMQYAGKAEGLPEDLAKNHDHYLYGTPKE